MNFHKDTELSVCKWIAVRQAVILLKQAFLRMGCLINSEIQ